MKRLLSALLLSSALVTPALADRTINGPIRAGTGLGGSGAGINVTNRFDATQYGSCTWTDAGDIGPCVNLAITAAGTAGGGVVVVPFLTYGVATKILVPSSLVGNVAIVGAGGGGNFGLCGTDLKWVGTPGDIMMQVGDDASFIIGTQVTDLCLDGNDTAGVGIKAVSLNKGHMARLSITNTTLDGLLLSLTTSDAAAFGFSSFDDILITNSTVGNTGNGLTFEANPLELDRDVHENIFSNITINVKDGIGFNCYGSDGNIFIRSRFNATGAAGIPAIFHGGTSATGFVNQCRRNFFYGTFLGLGANPAIFEGTDTPGVTTPSDGNWFFGNKWGDGEQIPTVGTGVKFYGWDSLGRSIPGSSPLAQKGMLPVVSYPTDRTLTYNDCGLAIDNQSAAGDITYTLPESTGSFCTYRFTRYAGHKITIQATNGAFIVSAGDAGSSSADGTVFSNAAFSTLEIQDISTDHWSVKEVTGFWYTDLGGQVGYTLGAHTSATPGDPTGTSNVTGLMMGISTASANAVITPTRSGTIAVTYSGRVFNSGAGDGAKVTIYTGTGTPPTNGAAITGTLCGSNPGTRATVIAANVSFPFSVTCLLNGATLSTARWTDIAVAAINNGAAGTASVADLAVVAVEQ